MQQILERILDQLRGSLRFRWLALAIAAVLCAVGWAAVLRIPDTYQATARVFVDTRTMLSEVTAGLTLDSNIETQINRVSQALLSAPELEALAEETGMLEGVTVPRERQDLIQALRTEIGISAAYMGGNGSVYTINYRNEDRDTALRVVDRLVNSFVEGALGGKRSGSESAQEFLVAQIADYERRLSEAEARLADFKRRNVGLMPGAQGDYFTRLQNETDALQKAQSDLDLALRQRATLQRQLTGSSPYLSTPSNGNEPRGSTENQLTLAVSGTTLRLQEAEAQREQLLLRYTEKHPEVVSLQQTIEELRLRQAEEMAAARRGDSAAAASVGLAANPVYQQIQLQFNQNEVQIAALQEDLANRTREVQRLRSLVDVAPGVEAEYAQLNRNYDIDRTQYEALLSRLERVRLGDEAQEEGAVDFQIIDPPVSPFLPVAPNRPVFIIAVLVLALGAGGGVAYLLHMLKPVYYSPRTLAAAAGVPVIGVISYTWLNRHRSQFRRGMLAYGAAVACLVVAAGALIALQARIYDLVPGVAP